MSDVALRPWLARIPDGWAVQRIKHVARFAGGGTPSKAVDDYWGGHIPWVSPKDMKVFRITETQDYITDAAVANSACSSIPAGSALMVVRSGILQHTIPVAINDLPVCLNQDMKALIPEAQILSEYLAYLVQGLNDRFLEEWVKQGATVESIDHESMANTQIPVPPKDQQRAIVAYLDVETARIDGLISDKKALLKTLKEMRQSTVAESITKGVAVERRLRKSGISWVSEIPSDWRSISLKRLVRVSGGHTPSTGNPAYWDGAIPWFSPKDMKADELFDSIDHVTELAVQESGLQVIEPGTTMIVVRGMILAHTFPVCVAQVSATINQDMKALIPDEDVDPSYLPWLLRGASALFLSLTEQSAHGTMALRTDRFMSERLPIPPLDEQLEIVEHLEAERRRIDALVEQVNQELDLLNELRSATITDAVLGRIDVRDHMKN